MKTEKLVNGIKMTLDDGSIEFTDRFGKKTTYANLDDYLEATKAVFEDLNTEDALNKIFKNW